MARTLLSLLVTAVALTAQPHPLETLITAARENSPRLRELLAAGLPGLAGRDGAAVWGQEFLFAVQSEETATVSIDHGPPLPMRRVAGSPFWYLLKTLRLGTTHRYAYAAGAKALGTYDVAGYNPDSYPRSGVPPGVLSSWKTLQSRIYPGMAANYWVFANAGVDLQNGAPLMVWQDGESIAGNVDLHATARR